MREDFLGTYAMAQSFWIPWSANLSAEKSKPLEDTNWLIFEKHSVGNFSARG